MGFNSGFKGLTTNGTTSILLLNSSTIPRGKTWNGQLNEIVIFCYRRQQLHAHNLQSINTGQKRNSFQLFQHLVTSFLMCTLHQILFGWSIQEVWDGRGTWHVVYKQKFYIGFLVGSLKWRDYLQHLGIERSVRIKWIFKRQSGRELEWSGSQKRHVNAVRKFGVP